MYHFLYCNFVKNTFKVGRKMSLCNKRSSYPPTQVSCIMSNIVDLSWTLSWWVGQCVSIYKDDNTHPPKYHVSCIISYNLTLLRTQLGWVRQCLDIYKNYHTHLPRYHASFLIFIKNSSAVVRAMS